MNKFALIDSDKYRLERIIVKLKIISQCKQNQRIRFKDSTIIILQDSFINSITRYFSNESRDDIISGIRTLLNDIGRLIYDITYNKSYDINDLLILKNGIYDILPDDIDNEDDEIAENIENKKNIVGLRSFLFTYKNDPSAIAEFYNIIENFNQIYKNLSDIIKGVSHKHS